MGGASSVESNAREIVKEIKRIREDNKITYMDIMEEMEKMDPTKVASLSTLRRVFRDGSESNAGGFNYEGTLLPILAALKRLDKKPKSKTPADEKLEGYKAVIRVQNEELDRLFEIKEHLDDRVNYLVAQSKVKDDQVAFLMAEIKEKNEMIRQLMKKCL